MLLVVGWHFPMVPTADWSRLRLHNCITFVSLSGASGICPLLSREDPTVAHHQRTVSVYYFLCILAH